MTLIWLHRVKRKKKGLKAILLFLMAMFLIIHAKSQGLADSSILAVETISENDSLLVQRLIDESGVRVEQGELEQPYQDLLRALQISKRYNYRKGKADSYMLLAHISKLRQRKTEALRYYFSALREFEWMSDLVSMAGIHKEIGNSYMQVGLNRKALEYYHRADSLYRLEGINDTDLQERTGDAYFEINEYFRAIEVYSPLIDLYEEAGEQERLIHLYSKIMICYQETKQFTRAAEVLDDLLELNRALEDPAGISTALNNIGYNYRYLGEYEKAIEYFERSLEGSVSQEQRTATLINLGVASQNAGQITRALDYLDEAYRLASSGELQDQAARSASIASRIYLETGDFYNAETYSRFAVQSAMKAGNFRLLADIYQTSSEINTAFFDFETALEDYQKYLSYRDSALIARNQVRQEYLQQEYLAERYEKEIGLLVTDEALQESMARELILDTIKKRQQIELQQKTIELQRSELQNRELEKTRLEQDKMLAEEKLAAEIRDREILELKIAQEAQKDSLERREYEVKVAQAENEVLKKDNELQQETIKRVRARNAFLAGIFLLALIILVFVIVGWRYARKTNRTLTHQRNKIQQQKDAIQTQYDIIEKEREKSDRLLLNILPEETAAELKEKGRATPRHYEMVSVLFTDFKGFTMVAESLTAEEVVMELDKCFLEFDKIAEKHNLEKIKTIGDAYMCAGGLPVANSSNPEDAVAAALEIRDFMATERKKRAASGESYWQLRIGINTGPVVAGVVGKNKFAYDIWGDAVNIASRMESSGEPGKVNISGATYELVKDRFVCSYRGKVAAKNKGEVDMYFVEKLR